MKEKKTEKKNEGSAGLKGGVCKRRNKRKKKGKCELKTARVRIHGDVK